MGKIEKANTQVEQAQRKTDASAKDVAVAFSGVATSAFALYNAVDRVQDMQVSVDRANLAVRVSLNGVEDAQNRYNSAVEKYGIESAQAKSASDELSIAQERYAVSVDRAEMIQGNMNEAMVSSALSVIPSMITMVSSISTLQASWGVITGGLTAAQHGLNAAMAANPIGIVLVAIAALVAILIVAYQTCEPFRNAVNAIGAVLKDVVLGAINAVVGALRWLWDVLTNNPIANFIKGLLGIGSESSNTANTVSSSASSIAGSMDAIGDAAGGANAAFGGAMVGVETRASSASKNVVSSMSTLTSSAVQAVKTLEQLMAEAEAEAAATIAKVQEDIQNIKTAAPGENLATPTTPTPGEVKKDVKVDTTTPPPTTAPPVSTAPKAEEPSKSVKAKDKYAAASGGEGIVSKPTLFLAGEAGPERYSFTPLGRGGGGGGSTIFAPQITIQGSVDERTIQQLMDRLRVMFRGFTLENSSSFAPTTSKRLRMEGSRTIGTGVSQ